MRSSPPHSGWTRPGRRGASGAGVAHRPPAAGALPALRRHGRAAQGPARPAASIAAAARRRAGHAAAGARRPARLGTGAADGGAARRRGAGSRLPGTADLRRLVAGAAVLVYPTLYEGLRAATTGGLRRGHTRGRQRPAGGPRGHRRAGHAGPVGDDAALAAAVAQALADQDPAARATRRARRRRSAGGRALSGRTRHTDRSVDRRLLRGSMASPHCRGGGRRRPHGVGDDSQPRDVADRQRPEGRERGHRTGRPLRTSARPVGPPTPVERNASRARYATESAACTPIAASRTSPPAGQAVRAALRRRR